MSMIAKVLKLVKTGLKGVSKVLNISTCSLLKSLRRIKIAKERKGKVALDPTCQQEASHLV